MTAAPSTAAPAAGTPVTVTPGTPKPAPAPPPAWFNLMQNPILLPVLAIAAVFMFMGKGKGGKEEKERLALLKQLKRGDRIQTIGGIQGAVVRAEENRVEVKVDESSNTKIWFARTAIARVLEASRADSK
jgi:preprotein translocase subunit YajC